MNEWDTIELQIVSKLRSHLYEEALALFKQIQRPLEPRLFIARCQCLCETKSYLEALELIQKAEHQRWFFPKLYKIKGICLYNLGEFTGAKAAFEEADKLKPKRETKRWIQRCIVKTDASIGMNTPRIIVTGEHECN